MPVLELIRNKHQEPDAPEMHSALTSNTDMDQEIIKAMARALKPVLNDRKRAEQILERFWRDKVAIVWTIQDAHTAANEREVALTNQDAVKVLQELYRSHNKQYGLKWEDLTAHIDEHALGRKMTKAEVNRFIETNGITIDRKRQ